MEWNQFSQRRGKGFGQILFIEEKKHWIFVYRKGGSNLNICYSLRNNGKQDYPENTVRVICRIACCIDSALKVNCLQVQQQSNSIDCGVFAIASTKWKLLWRYWNAEPLVSMCATTGIITFFKYFKEGSTLQTFSTIHWYFLCMPTKLFYERYER